MGLSNNNAVKEFYPPTGATHFKIRCVLDFYGPSDFVMLAGTPNPAINDPRNPLSLLLGAQPIDRLDLAGMKNQLIIVPNAPHAGKMFDADDIRGGVFAVLKENMR